MLEPIPTLVGWRRSTLWTTIFFFFRITIVFLVKKVDLFKAQLCCFSVLMIKVFTKMIWRTSTQSLSTALTFEEIFGLNRETCTRYVYYVKQERVMMYAVKSTPAVEHSDSLDASEQMDRTFPEQWWLHSYILHDGPRSACEISLAFKIS